jgi:general secretion pathway protein L
MRARLVGAKPDRYRRMFRKFLLWWFGQLAELVPLRLRSADAAGGDALVITPAGPLSKLIDHVDITLRRGGRETSLGRFGISESSLDRVPRAAGTPAVIRLAAGEVLGKTLSLPLAAERQLDQVLEFEMDRETPFNAEELFWTYRLARRDRQTGTLLVRLLLLPRASLERLLAGLDQIGLRPGWAEIAGGPDKGSRVPLSDHQTGPHGFVRRWSLWAAGAVCMLLALAAVLVPFARQSAEAVAIERRIAADRQIAAEAEKLRQEIDQLSGSIGLVESERTKAGRPIAVLAALTRLLPDDTYLTEFAQQQRKVTLSGRSAAASRLIGMLSGDELLRNPAFAAPVTRIEATRSEVFSITAEVAP